MSASRRRRGRPDRGQSLVEFSLVLPVFLVLLMSMMDFGFAYGQNLTIEYATREGARTGAALAAGNSTLPCADVDDYVMAAVQRVLESPGSQVKLEYIDNVEIYKSDAAGNKLGSNRWGYMAGDRPTVDGVTLDFGLLSTGWDACTRSNATPNPDSLGVLIHYQYHYVTPLGSAIALLGSHHAGPPTLSISDHTVMQLNPTNL